MICESGSGFSSCIEKFGEPGRIVGIYNVDALYGNIPIYHFMRENGVVPVSGMPGFGWLDVTCLGFAGIGLVSGDKSPLHHGPSTQIPVWSFYWFASEVVSRSVERGS